ncbi:MAG: AAA family ATPase [bacterium]|nr:AAA family ATPase [bacterium]
MKIQKLQMYDVKTSRNHNNSKKQETQTTTIPNETNLNHKFNNVSFSGFGGMQLFKSTKGSSEKLRTLENNTSYYGEIFINEAKDLAQQYGLREITQPIMLLVGLKNLVSYIDELNAGIATCDDYTSFSAPAVLISVLCDDVIDNKTKRNQIYPLMQEEILTLTKMLEQEQTPHKINPKRISFSKDYLNDLYVEYSDLMLDEKDVTSPMLTDAILFDAAFNPQNDEIRKKVTEPFQLALKNAVYLDKRKLDERTHLSFYDEKATNILNNLAINTNMTILHDDETQPDYLINSIIHLFENNENGYGKLNRTNTEIINFNSNGEIDMSYLNKKFKEFAKQPDKNFILIMNIMNQTLKSLDIDESNVNSFINAPKNIKFIMLADKNNYYMESDKPEMKGFFDSFGEVTIPLMNMVQAQQAFQEQPKLMSKVKKKMTPNAINKCVEVANQLKGNYPEKAQKVMELISAYYVDKEEISEDDVSSYVKEAKDLFKPIDNSGSAVRFLPDTNIRIKDMVGSPTTKKEAMSIVENIKDKTIGTKGYIIYSQDYSVGAGRKYTAKAIAGETQSPYFEINAVDFGTEKVSLFDAFSGESALSPEAAMKKLFSKIRAQAETNPTKSAIVFIENFECFSYGKNISEYHSKAMSQLIREMDEAQDDGLNIVIIGSMTYPNYIDDATSKSFKFIDKIEIESPGTDANARKEIINYYLKQKNIKLAGDNIEQDKTITHIISLTEYSSYIEILTLLDKVKHIAKERKHEQNGIEKGDFTEAYLQIECGRPRVAQNPQYSKEIIASHECGHALNSVIMEELALKQNKPTHLGSKMNFITLDPRGYYGGCVFLSTQENPEISAERIFSEIVSAFGGTSCEKIIYGQDGSYGITCDMKDATQKAEVAVTTMGQGKNYGKKSLPGSAFLSEKDKDTINQDVNTILKNAQVVSEAITYMYKDFITEFTNKYASKVGTGECIIQREEFITQLNDWRNKQTDDKKADFASLDNDILKVIDATQKGIICSFEK